MQRSSAGRARGEWERKFLPWPPGQHRNQRAQVKCPQRQRLRSKAPPEAGVTSAKCQHLRLPCGSRPSGSPHPAAPSRSLRG